VPLLMRRVHEVRRPDRLRIGTGRAPAGQGLRYDGRFGSAGVQDRERPWAAWGRRKQIGSAGVAIERRHAFGAAVQATRTPKWSFTDRRLNPGRGFTVSQALEDPIFHASESGAATLRPCW